MGQPLVTIIIPTYNDDPGHLAEAVASALEQSVPVEVVVVDDGSDEPVVLNGVRVIRQDNAGVATARNTGIRETTGDVVVCLDADDWLSPTYAAEAVVLLADESVTIAGPSRVEKFGDASESWADTGEDFTLPDFAQRSRVAVASAFRRTDRQRAGGYDESPQMRPGHEDHEWWVRLLGKCGGRTATMRTAVLHYRVRSDSAFHRGNLSDDERVTRGRILANSDQGTLQQLLQGAWVHGDRLEKDLERARRSRIKDSIWKVRQRMRRPFARVSASRR